MSRQPWYESDNPGTVARGLGWRAAAWTIATVVFFGLIGIAVWGFNVATSDVKGRGDAARQVNSADNRLFAQGNFQDLYNEVISSQQKLEQAAADKAAHAGKDDESFYDANYTGLVNHCIDTRNQYNAAAQKITQARFRDAGLPAQLDPSDPRFACKETSK